MKIKLVAAAVLALCSSASFAATAVTCVTTDALSMVNTCAPEATLYIAGSSALGGALSTVVVADLFTTATKPIIKIVDNGSANGNLAGSATALKAVSAWYGISKADGKRLFVVYNKQNGSAAGVSQLLSTIKDTTIPEQDIVTVGIGSTGTKGAVGTCTADAASTTAVPVLNCTTHARVQADMALSDVAPSELFALEGVKPAVLSTLTTTPIAMQGFGIAVNAKLYAELQRLQGTTGRPSINRATYASLISKEGSVKSAAAFLGTSDTTKLVLARRDDLSGTQAASNLFFANNSCGINHDAKGKLIAGVAGGALSILDNKTLPTAILEVQANATGGGVTTALANTTDYVIGAISLTTAEPATGWKFVAIDGASPLATDAKQRDAFRTGAYGWSVQSFAATPLRAKMKDAVKLALTDVVTIGLKDSTLHNLIGIAYQDGGVSAQQSQVTRTNGNNCSPLISLNK
ncbi:hypothetical protein [Actimicrobium sp. CCI2.3]|uniref:hypothetical protein n=1 Tax=Actimicrobium sp. CCI2.3 TaxID=3048616 RepID=UPI002AB4240B|nr:hypothetical protein [Actimicrobium sp. CCI2.3]MDY7574735.1 hypothetical protein [Actimicrobium sp. CCI2.3]MEB0020304.1 hypothetical protein [Actimicrobium sp. CCI2.3]